MTQDILRSTLNENSKPENRLRAIRMYALGVREDFRTTHAAQVWMENILHLAGYDKDGEPLR